MSRRPRFAFVPILIGLACSGPDHSSSRVPLERIGTEALTLLSPPSDTLWGIRDVVETKGTYWVLTGTAPFLRAYGRQGSRIAAFGRDGDGPDELRVPRALWPGDPVGTVTVWDVGRREALTFALTGQLLEARPMPTSGVIRTDISMVTYGNPHRAFQRAGAVIVSQYTSGVSIGRDLWSGELVRVPRGPSSVRTVIVSLARDLKGAVRLADRVRFLGPVPLWDGCPDGQVAVLDPVSRVIILVDPLHGSRDSISLPFQPADLRRSERLRYIRFQMARELRNEHLAEAEIDRLAESAAGNAEDLFPQQAPLAVDLKCAEDRVWLQDFDGASHPLGYGPLWRTVALNGATPETGRVSFPAGFSPFRISASQALGVVTDSLSLQRLAIVRLPDY